MKYRTFSRSVLHLLLVLCLTAAALPAPPALAQDDPAPRPAAGKGATVPEFVPGEVLVRFRLGSEAAKVGVGQRARLAALRAADGREVPAEVENVKGFEIVEGLRMARVRAEDTLRAVEAFNARPDVLYAEPNYVWRKQALPNDTRFGDLWGLRNTGQQGFNDVAQAVQSGTPGEDIEAELAWNTTIGSQNVVVAVLDEGIDINHGDLQANIWTNPVDSTVNGIDDDANGFVDDTNGWDFRNNDRTVYDGAPGSETDAHGTHVAGTIGARGNNGRGVTGVNWNVSIMSVKVIGPTGGSTANFIAGYNYVRMMRAEKGINVRVTNNSYGGPGFSQSAFDAVSRLNQAGILFVAAAGNDAQDNFSFPHYPSDYDLPNVLNVAATDRFGQMAVFSSFGARAISMGAPGRGILSTTPRNFPISQVGSTDADGSTYDFFSGTSMATPHVAGAAALLLSVHPNLSVQNLRGALAFSGDRLPSLQGRTTTGRRLNVNEALKSAADTTAPAAPGGLHVTAQNGRNFTFQWTAPGDDGSSGTAADYDFFFVTTGGSRLLLPTTVQPAPASTTQSATVTLPYRNFSGTVEMRTYDDAGNVGTASVPVTLPQNADTDPYVVTQGGPESLSTGGTALNINGDDVFRENVALPFAFPFFGVNRTSVTVSANGVLYFSRIPLNEDGSGADAGSSELGLRGQAMIAGLWDDLRTDRGGNIFMFEPAPGRVIFRWQAVTFNTQLNNNTTRGEQPVNFEIELRNDGTIITRYGAGQSAPTNTRLFPVVGIGSGEPDAYVVTSHTSFFLTSLTNAASVVFTPRSAGQPGTPGTLQFSNASFAASEAAGTATITVTRTGGTDGAVSVNFATSNGTATAGSDYTATSGTLNFANGESQKTFAVPLTNDALFEADETVNLTLSNATGGAALGSPATAALTISNDDAAPSFVINDVTLAEGNSGGTTFLFNVTKTGQTALTSSVNFATADGTAFAPQDYAATSGTLTFAPGDTLKSFGVVVNGDRTDEPNETFFVNLSGAMNAAIADAQGVGTITNDDTPVINGTVQFASASQTVGEGALSATVTVTRTDGSAAGSVDYAVNGGTADSTKDYTPIFGRLDFAPGETTKSVTVLITDDVFAEGSETIQLSLSNPVGMALGSTSTATVTVTDNDPTTGANPVKPESFNTGFFVRQHYLDFFTREPDAPGLAHWTNVANGCGEPDLLVCRINVSGAFFLSIEFEQTGYLVERLYKSAYGDATGTSTLGGTPHTLQVPIVRLEEFLPDTQRIGRGVVVHQGDWQNQLEANKVAFTREFVERARFVAVFPHTMSASQFVDQLIQRSGAALTANERQSLVSEYANGQGSTAARASVLRQVAEHRTVVEAEKNRAFVLMQYFGYLRRDPNEGPDADYTGYDFWLGNLNRFQGNFVQAELVKAFITSTEYQARFGPTN